MSSKKNSKAKTMAKSKISKEKSSITVRDIKKALSSLFTDDVAFIYIFGSYRTKKYNDIDILVVADNFQSSNESMKNLERQISGLEKQYKKSLNLHIQPVTILSSWWLAIIKGEPWILTSLKKSVSIYDKNNILKNTKDLLEKEKTYNSIIKRGDLSQLSRECQLSNREVLLRSLESLSAILKEAVQIYLLSNKKIIVDEELIYDELKESKLSEYAEDYKEILDLEKKYHRGYLNEFTAENLDYYLNKIQGIWKKLEKSL